MEAGVSKLEQINGIFLQFSEGNKDKLLETAERLLKTQEKDTASVRELEGRCPEKNSL